MDRSAAPVYSRPVREQTDIFASPEAPPSPDGSWFVYLFALSDCSAFKVGFSCNPLQRIFTFSPRYFERFDLPQSMLLQLAGCDEARAIEAALKSELAQFRIDAPTWIPREAGGHTEWFSAVHLGHAGQRLQSFLQEDDPTRLTDPCVFIHDQLSRLVSCFEPWAWSQAQHVYDAWSARWSAAGGHIRTQSVRSLRNWLDAYRFFDIPLFNDDPAVREFVMNSARLPC
jgi:hypothetical protein